MALVCLCLCVGQIKIACKQLDPQEPLMTRRALSSMLRQDAKMRLVTKHPPLEAGRWNTGQVRCYLLRTRPDARSACRTVIVHACLEHNSIHALHLISVSPLLLASMMPMPRSTGINTNANFNCAISYLLHV